MALGGDQAFPCIQAQLRETLPSARPPSSLSSSARLDAAIQAPGDLRERHY